MPVKCYQEYFTRFRWNGNSPCTHQIHGRKEIQNIRREHCRQCILEAIILFSEYMKYSQIERGDVHSE